MGKLKQYQYGEVLNSDTGTIFLSEEPKRGKTRYARMKCGLCGRIYVAAIYPVTRGRTCKYCKGKKISATKNKKIYKPGDILNKETNSQLIEIISGDGDSRSYGRIRCGYCGNIYISRIDHVKGGHLCNNCRGERISNTSIKYHEGDVITSSDGLFQYLFVKELPSDKPYRKGLFKLLNAPDGITIKEYFYSTLPGIIRDGAHGGNLSYGELRFGMLLEQMNVSYYWQYSFDDLIGKNNHKLSFDFMIPLKNDAKLLIEIDGEQHERPVEFFGGMKNFIIRQNYDIKKEQYIESHSKLQLLRISTQEIRKMTVSDVKTILSQYHLVD